MGAIVKEAVKKLIPMIAGAFQADRAADSINQPSGDPIASGPVQRSLPEYEGATADSDVLDPNAPGIDASGSGSIPMDQELRNAAATEATTTCQNCPVCGFMVDGKYVYASYPVPHAMDYQDRVVRLVAMGNLPFEMEPTATRIQEWQLPHAAAGGDPGSETGFRSIDGFALLPCMLIEAKLGYGGYLQDVYNLRVDRRMPTDIARTMPEINKDVRYADARMRAFATQMRNHENLAGRYPRTSVPTQHTVVWCCSNMKTFLYCGGLALLQGLDRIRAFHVPIGMLPPSRWVPE